MLNPSMDFAAERHKALEQCDNKEITFDLFEDRIIEIASAEMAHEIDCEIMKDITNELEKRVKSQPNWQCGYPTNGGRKWR